MDFQDDGFEGSANEEIIFREIFFGNGSSHSNKWCPHKAFSYEHRPCKINDASLCSSSEPSTVSSYSYSRNMKLDECYNATENIRTGSASNSLPCKRISVEGDDGNASGKRIKVSTDEASDSVPNLVKLKQSSDSIRVPVSANCYPAEECDSESFTFHIVESSRQGIISSCYRLKDLVEMDSNLGDPDAVKRTSLNLEGNDEPNMVNKVSASPVSQESSMTRLLVASPDTINEKVGSPLHLEVGQMKSLCPELGASLKTDLSRDPRPLLHYHVVHLFIAAGWSIERVKRPCRRYMETVYRSPQGRAFREFSKAWRFCGELLFADRCSFVKDVDSKEWTGIHQFLFDLSDTLLQFGKEMNQLGATTSLANCWVILDPYVVVVFIDRKIGPLRRGDLVRATCSVGINGSGKTDAFVTLVNEDNSICNLSADKNASPLHDNSPSAKSALTEAPLKDLDGGNCAFDEQTCDTSLSNYYGHTEDGTTKFSTRVSNYDPNLENGLNCTGSHFNEPGNKIEPEDLTSSPAYFSGSTCKPRCLADGPVPSGNSDNVVRISGLTSPDEDSTLYCSDEQSSENHVENPNEMMKNALTCSLVEGKKLEVPLGKAENNLEESLNDCANYTSDGLSHSCASGVVQKSSQNEEGGLNFSASMFKTEDKVSAIHSILKKKGRQKCKKISEIKPNLPPQIDIDGSCSQLDMIEDQKSHIADTKNVDSHEKNLSLSPISCHSERKSSKLKKNFDSLKGSKTRKKKLNECQIEDDDLLVSAIIRNKDVSSSAAGFSHVRKYLKSRAKMNRKSQKSSCKLLLRSLGNGEKNYKDGKWYALGARTVLSWLLDAGVISSNDIIQYQSPKDGSVVKYGRITGDGIICNCCGDLLSISKFKSHAGFKFNRACLNLFLDSGRPFMLCQLQAWSTEYKTRKSRTRTVEVDEDDRNDDSCGICGDGGELICCDNCPSTFHHSCLSIQELPEGNWYCLNCTCRICGGLVNYEEISSSFDALKCFQCEQKYHGQCLKQRDINSGVESHIWFCSDSCQKIYTALQSRLGLTNQFANGFSWMLLRCIHNDQKILSTPRLAMMAECNSRLVVALTIMEECFLSMVDPRTGIDMIPHLVYSWKSSFPRLDFHGFYTVILEKDDVLLCVASIRVHGSELAEMPLIATCSKYRRQGMCRRLLKAIEEMLMSFKVKKLVIAAIPSLVETWTEGFGFAPVENEEKQSLHRFNLMVFPGTVLLKKALYVSGQTTETTVGVQLDTNTKQQCNSNEPCPRMEMKCSKYQELQEHNGEKTKDDHEANPAPPVDSSTLQLVESNGLDTSPGQKFVESNCCTDIVGATTETCNHEAKKLLKVEVGVECDIQLSEGKSWDEGVHGATMTRFVEPVVLT
ncbi:increased DNA methylation 1 isoform X1 [Cucumis melo]|uniref:Increased DNA methylation 1 isoform X1 n=1 Tax=Cucumis melo TaxID=3656 RepID=A0ABM3L1K5_CUCME|nr:increased DNA methylation 1 isoform X1 [Cucumis melo]XP_050943917.1 increased DNA methylation 1 isoform X1 [Cucumis melo]